MGENWEKMGGNGRKKGSDGMQYPFFTVPLQFSLRSKTFLSSFHKNQITDRRMENFSFLELSLPQQPLSLPEHPGRTLRCAQVGDCTGEQAGAPKPGSLRLPKPHPLLWHRRYWAQLAPLFSHALVCVVRCGALQYQGDHR